MDFDGENWQKDITAVRNVCTLKQIPVYAERSRSGNGAHIWIFFSEPVLAVAARRLGAAILTYAMETRHDIKFSSYDRLFPNQDTLPKGGFGNLIALPLQRVARERGNSVFIDERFEPYADQWAYLSSVRRMSAEETAYMTDVLCKKGELGTLRDSDNDEQDEPWQAKPQRPPLTKKDFANVLNVTERDGSLG